MQRKRPGSIQRIWQATGRLIGLLAVTLWIAPSVQAQFNGNFEIERHFLEIENFLDWKAYQMPISWRYEWYLTHNGFRTSVGSVAMDRFYTDHEIRLEKEIGNFFTLLYKQQETSFWDQKPLYQEAEFRFGKDLYASIIGFPQHDKKNSHSGYALAYGKIRDPVYVQIGFLEQFLVYNEKNSTTDTNVNDRSFKQIPIMMRFDGQFYREKQFFVKLDYVIVHPTTFIIQDPVETKEYDGDELDLIVDWLSDQGGIIGMTAKSKKEYRSQNPDTITTAAPDLDQSIQYQWLDLYASFRLHNRDRITFGWLDSLFENRIGSSFARHQYLCRFKTQQVYSKWEHRRSDWFRWLFSFQAGFAELDKQFIEIEEDPHQESWELKAGVGIIMVERAAYRFFANTTWDLDLFDTRQWDGGNVQLQLRF